MPDAIDNHIESIQLKLTVLIKNYQALLVENKRLKNDHEQLKLSHEALKEVAANVEQQNQILKASTGKMEGAEKLAFEKVINQYIKSIDKCMTMLNN